MSGNPNESVTYIAVVDEAGNVVQRVKVTVTVTIAEVEVNGAGDEATATEAPPVAWDRVVADLRDLVDQMNLRPDYPLLRDVEARRKEFQEVASRMIRGKAELNDLKRAFLALDRAARDCFGAQTLAYRWFIDAEIGKCTGKTEG